MPGDDRILAARDAFRNGERIRTPSTYTRSVSGSHNEPLPHDLDPWVNYWQLRQHIDSVPVENIIAFLTHQNGTYLAEKLRGDWLKVLAKRQQWNEFRQVYTLLQQPDQELICANHLARLSLQREAESASALDIDISQWIRILDLPETCLALMSHLVSIGKIDEDAIWGRIRHLLEAKRLAGAIRTAGYLPAYQRPTLQTLEVILDKPQHVLDTLPNDFASTRRNREMALFAIQRLACANPISATTNWQKIKKYFSSAERSYAWGQIAMQAAQRHLPEASNWYSYATQEKSPARLSDEQLAWQVRAALRIYDWPLVQKSIAQLPSHMASQSDWVYWLARAHAAQNRLQEAHSLYREISGQPNFYSNLADSELNRPVTTPLRASPPTASELAAARSHPGLRRALALIRLDIRLEGIREWNWAIRKMDDRQLLAAAELARLSNIFDRAIYTAEQTRDQHDYALRYLSPFRDSVMPAAHDVSLDSGWIYGLMRQESRFVMSARSGVGAKGLMQLMPKTAEWVAHKIGLKHYHPSHVESLKTNIALGTQYLRMVYTSLDHHPVLASAAYNAGPGRARRWRANVPIEGAIYVETIPFDETRDYVKKVMSNTLYYAALFEEQPQSMKSRLGTINPRLPDTSTTSISNPP